MNPNSNYQPDIDELRAVAVLAVGLHHLSASLVPGSYVGMDVISLSPTTVNQEKK